MWNTSNGAFSNAWNCFYWRVIYFTWLSCYVGLTPLRVPVASTYINCPLRWTARSGMITHSSVFASRVWHWKQSSILSRLHLSASQKMIALFVSVQVSTSRNCGAVWLLSTLCKCLCFLPAAALLCFSHSMVLLIRILKCFVFTRHCMWSVFFVFLFGWIHNIFAFVLLQPPGLQKFFIGAARLATLHSTKTGYHEIYGA